MTMRRMGLVELMSETFDLVFEAQFLFFKRRDPDFVPIGMGHFIFDELLQFLMLFGELLYMPLKSHRAPRRLEPRQLDHYWRILSRILSSHALITVNQ